MEGEGVDEMTVWGCDCAGALLVELANLSVDVLFTSDEVGLSCVVDS